MPIEKSSARPRNNTDALEGLAALALLGAQAEAGGVDLADTGM